MNFISENALNRTILSIIMLITFYFIVQSQLVTILLILIIKYISFTEIFLLKKTEKNNKIMTFLSYHFLLCFDLRFLHTLINYNNRTIDLSFLCFILYLLGLIIFILNLKKNNLRKNFLHFSTIHISIFILNFPANQAISLTIQNQFWFIYSVLLVIINDISAYIIGKNFGKTQLIKLSPKKTLEGFLGAWIVTTIFGYLLLFYKKTNNIFPNAFVDFSSSINIFRFKFIKTYIHCFFIVTFASLFAPFGGFFASAYKRLIKVKDFSSYIPGHGGILDRMDCQFLMSLFMKLYWKTFILKSNNIKSVSNKLFKEYNKNEIIELISFLLEDLLN